MNSADAPRSVLMPHHFSFASDFATPPSCDVGNMPKVASRLRKMAVKAANHPLGDVSTVDDALFLLEAADLIDVQYETLRPRTARERGQMTGWMPAVISQVVQRIAGWRAGA